MKKNTTATRRTPTGLTPTPLIVVRRYNATMSIPDDVRVLEHELREICGARLQSLVVYGQRAREHHAGDHHGAHGSQAPSVRTLAVIEDLSAADLRACAARTESWHDRGLATPLLVAAHEFGRSLDAFPLEFGAIIADHVVVAGANPFETLRVDPLDVRRACEVQARSHLLHLRDGYLETRGRADALSLRIVESAPAFASLIKSLARLERPVGDDAAAAARHAERTLAAPPGSIGAIVGLVGVDEISSAQAEQLFPPYLAAVERLVHYVDGWSRRA